MFFSVHKDCFFILANSADTDEMQLHAFRLGLHCFPKYPFRGFQYTNLKLGIFNGHTASFKIGVLKILNFYPCSLENEICFEN